MVEKKTKTKATSSKKVTKKETKEVLDEGFITSKIWSGSLKEYNKLNDVSNDTMYIVEDDMQALDMISDEKSSYDQTYSSAKIESLFANIYQALTRFLDLNKMRNFMLTKDFKQATVRLAHPGKRKIKMILCASGTTYIADKTGYVVLKKLKAVSSGYICLENLDTGISTSSCMLPDMNEECSVYLPVQKGEKFKIKYSGDWEKHTLAFILAEGEE